MNTFIERNFLRTCFDFLPSFAWNRFRLDWIDASTRCDFRRSKKKWKLKRIRANAHCTHTHSSNENQREKWNDVKWTDNVVLLVHLHTQNGEKSTVHRSQYGMANVFHLARGSHSKLMSLLSLMLLLFGTFTKSYLHTHTHQRFPLYVKSSNSRVLLLLYRLWLECCFYMFTHCAYCKSNVKTQQIY